MIYLSLEEALGDLLELSKQNHLKQKLVLQIM